MAAGRVTKNLRDGIMRLLDNADANTITLALESGDLTFDMPTPGAVINVLDRGDLDHMREGDEAPVTGSFTLKYVECWHQDAEAGNDPTPFQAITNTGNASAWVSTYQAISEVYALTMEYEIATPTIGEKNEQFSFLYTTFTPRMNESDEFNTLSFDFQAFITLPTVEKIGDAVS